MASDDDEFALLGDDGQSRPHHQHAHPPAAPVTAASFSGHRYVMKQAMPLLRPHPLSAVADAKEGLVGVDSSGGDEDEEDQEGFGEACAAAAFNDVDQHHHCFTGDVAGAGPFAAQPHQEAVNAAADNADNNHDHKSHGSIHHNHHPNPPPPRMDHKHRDRDELSDGESPDRFNSSTKKSRPMPSSSGDYRKDREEWSDLAIGCLLDAYTEKYIQLNRGNLRGRDWEDVAATVSERSDKQKSGKSVEQCKNKVDNLKKRFKVECQRLSSGTLTASHWPWFKKMEQIVGPSTSTKVAGDDEQALALSGPTSVARQMKRYPVTSPGSVGLINNFKMKSLSPPRWKRVVLKISGATLAGPGPQNVDPKVNMLIAREIAMANRVGVEVAVVVGGRNFFCGDTWVAATGIDRATAYQIGMMASAMNSLLLQASLEKAGVEARVQTGFLMQEIAEPYIRRRAIRHLEKGRVVIFGGVGTGTGNPLFTTDTAAVLRASEINADAMLKGTDADAMYDCHSRNNSVAFEHISFRELVSRGFTAMDMTAITFCEENNIPVVLFNLLEPGNISRALCGDQVGTLVDLSGRIS